MTRKSRQLRLGLLAICFAAASAPSAWSVTPAKAWIFFDLGENSLVATPKDSSGDIASVSWIRYQGADGQVTDSHTYVSTLRAHGYHTGVIINLPEDWGDPTLAGAHQWLIERDPARKAELAARLTAAKTEVINDYFEGRGPGDPPGQPRRWRDPQHAGMDFNIFNRGNILLPFLDRFRKPMDGPAESEDQLFLYRQAIALAARHGARAIYQGADAHDIAGARKAGMLTRLLPYRPGQPIQAKDYYLSEAQIDQLAANAEAGDQPRAALAGR